MSVFYKNTRRVLSIAAENGSYDQGGCVRRGLTSPAYNVEPVTNTSSPSCANNGDGRRGQCSARRRSSRLCFSQFATRTVDNTVDLYAAKPDIRQKSQIFVQNRVFCLPHLHSTPPLGGFPSEYCHPVWYGKTRMAWLPDGEKMSMICLFVLT